MRSFRGDQRGRELFRALLATYDPEEDRPALVILLHELAVAKSRLLAMQDAECEVEVAITELEDAGFRDAGDDGDAVDRVAQAAKRLRAFARAHDGEKGILAATKEMRLITDDVRKYDESRAIELRESVVRELARVAAEVVMDETVEREDIAGEVARRLRLI